MISELLSGPGASPSDLLEAGQFTEWYPGQFDSLMSMIDWYHSPARFLGVSLPTGSGKSVLALLLSKITAARACILTATKGLTWQYLQDAAGVGGVEVKGRNNFPCLLDRSVSAEDGICRFGFRCDLRDNCPYRQQLERAKASDLVITNYAYWLAQTNYSDGLGTFDLLICDEGHMAFSAMEGFLTVFIGRLDIQPLGVMFPSLGPDQWASWRLWADSAWRAVAASASEMEADIRSRRVQGKHVPGGEVRSARHRAAVAARLRRIAKLDESWVVQSTRHGFLFTPKWVSGYADNLFQPRGVSKVMLMSAILSPRTVDYLGVPSGNERRWLEGRSYFPAENTPIWHVDTARINYRTGPLETGLWVSRIDQVIQRRLDRKGLVFTVSYDRARLLMSRSRFKDVMITHSTWDVVQAVERFKAAEPPIVLVSPSVTTGYDFPMQDRAQYIVIGKIPYPDTSDPVTRARHEDDKDWASYMAMETLIQSCGRATRGAEDRAEVLVLDDNMRWFVPRFREFAPAWFLARYRGTLATVPDPLV